MTKTLEDYDFVIAIDFGTAFSGYQILKLGGFQTTDRKYLPNHLWNFKNEPSTMFYINESWNNFLGGIKANDKFKNNPESGHYVTKVKLWLDSSVKDDLPQLPPNKTPVQVIGDYLKEMRSAIYSQIDYENQNCKDTYRYRYCIAVPTLWSEQSKGIMRDAAILAGLITKYDEPGRLLIVDEAVAATLDAERIFPELELARKSLYMICDAGGGTVDLAVFEKDDSPGRSGLKEITLGTGSICGSTFLDTRFETLLRERTSKYPKFKEQDIQYILWRFNDDLKKLFGGKDEEYVSDRLDKMNKLYFAGHPNISDDEGFTLEEIRTKVFDPVVNKVLGTIEKQFERLGGKELDAMFITGGFGQSPYLQTRIKDTFVNRVKQFKVVEDGNKSVMKGAVLFAENPRIIAQCILRRTYAIKLHLPTNETENYNGIEFEKEQIQVLVRKGEPVNEDKWISKRVYWKDDELPIIYLYGYDGDAPIPENPTAKDVELVAIFDTDFPVDDRTWVDREVLDMKLCFCADMIKVKINVAGGEFEYVTVWDLVGDKTFQHYKGKYLPPPVKARKLWLAKEILQKRNFI